MNSNLAEVGKPSRWPPGQNGNRAGKPPGTRTAFSQGFIRDFALVWAEEGLEAVRCAEFVRTYCRKVTQASANLIP
jgi:hypothetical protein